MIDRPFVRSREGTDALEEGYYLIQRRRARRVDIPVRIWFGPPVDRDTGEELDRSPRWQVTIAGTLLDQEPVMVGGILFDSLTVFWPSCRDHRISPADYDYRLQRTAWAAEYDLEDAFATPGGRIDCMTARLPFS